MKTLTLALMMTGALAVGAPALAQDHPYENGPVWQISQVTTKPGRFEDYMKFVAGPWRAEQENPKKAGYVLDYKVLNLQDNRDGEPDLLLMVEYKNMAAFDAPMSVSDTVDKQVFGSASAAQTANIDREQIRHVGSTILTRELALK